MLRTQAGAGLPAVAAETDAALVAIDEAFDHLVDITPLDVGEAWAAFRAGGFRDAPPFTYRTVTAGLDALHARLAALPLERVTDRALSALFEAKRRELAGQLRLVEQRNTAAFLDTSLELYGGVEPELVGAAEELLGHARPGPAAGDGDSIGAATFARRAREEIAHYRRQWPSVAATAEVRHDLPGVLVSDGRLLVGHGLAVPPNRVEALIHHEVGTHLLTYENGRAQPLSLLRVGLPGAEETQEGLAVLAEYLVGGLTPARLALLAARVVAVDHLLEGDSFAGAFDVLHRRHRFAPGASFRVVMRVYRSGGLTKDAVYLRGLERLLSHVGAGGALEPLLVGKLDVLHVPVVEELMAGGLLRPVPLRPRWLSHPGAEGRMAQLRSGLRLDDLWREVCR